MTMGHSCHPTQLATQQCTRMPQNGVEGPFPPICVHSRGPHGCSCDRAGPRVPRHRRPHSPRDAMGLGPEAHATRAVTQPPTRTHEPGVPLSGDMLPNMPHSRMPPTPPLRPSHPRPGVARSLGPRVKGRVLPNSPRSAPLTGGRFRRPAKAHEGTPSGAHFSHRCRVWRPAGGPGECRDAGRVYGSPPA